MPKRLALLGVLPSVLSMTALCIGWTEASAQDHRGSNLHPLNPHSPDDALISTKLAPIQI